jgi:hypothetical protein
LAQYTTVVQATSNSTVNTADTFLELKAPASVTIKIKRVRVGYGDGTQTAGVDNHFRVTLYRWNTTTAGSSSSYTPVPRNANSQVAVSTAKIKNATTALALGTTQTVLDIIAPNGRALYEWLARDDDDMIVTLPGDCFAVVIQSPVVSQLFTCSVDHIE